jgi:hypothetical protein
LLWISPTPKRLKTAGRTGGGLALPNLGQL